MGNATFDELRREYLAKRQRNETRTAELHTEKKNLEKCQDEIWKVFPNTIRGLDETQGELWDKNATEDMRELGMLTERTHNNFTKAKHTLEEELDNIERQQKALADEREQLETAYRKSVAQLEKEAKEENKGGRTP